MKRSKKIEISVGVVLSIILLSICLIRGSEAHAIASVNVSATEAGATVGGSESNQRFVRADIDVEDKVYRLALKIVGLDREGRF